MMKDLKLNAINRRRLADKQMNSIKGGESNRPAGSCGCACQYANNQGSTTIANADANTDRGLWSTSGTIQIVTLPPAIVKP